MLSHNDPAALRSCGIRPTKLARVPKSQNTTETQYDKLQPQFRKTARCVLASSTMPNTIIFLLFYLLRLLCNLVTYFVFFYKQHYKYLQNLSRSYPTLFEHWQYKGFRPSKFWIKKIRMNWEVHVRFCERSTGESPLYLIDFLSVFLLSFRIIFQIIKIYNIRYLVTH
jgi:hypothetical protein